MSRPPESPDGQDKRMPEIDERLGDLLVQHVLGTLSDGDRRELATLTRGHDAHTIAEWERAAGELAAELALSNDGREAEADHDGYRLPPELADRLIAQGEHMMRARRTALPTPRDVRPIAARDGAGPSARTTGRWTAWSGWGAAAAALLFALMRGTGEDVPRPGAAPTVVAGTAAPAASASAMLRDSLLRDSLLQTDGVLTRLPWTRGGDSTALAATGDIVWSGRAQRGVMRIVGLVPNDRQRWQYQLWIFDRTRDARYPVDGGVFDVPAGATEILVPIDARVPVGNATMFAVTVEPAGGVVVSTRARVALLAGS